MSSSKAPFISVLSNDLGKYAKDRVLNFNTSFIFYEVQEVYLKVMESITVSGAGVTDANRFQRRLHGVDQNRQSGSDSIVIRVVVLHRDSFPSRILMNSAALRWILSWK